MPSIFAVNLRTDFAHKQQVFQARMHLHCTTLSIATAPEPLHHRPTGQASDQVATERPVGLFPPPANTTVGKPLNNLVQNSRLPLPKKLAKAKFLSKSVFVCFFSSPLVQIDRNKTDYCSDQAPGIPNAKPFPVLAAGKRNLYLPRM